MGSESDKKYTTSWYEYGYRKETPIFYNDIG